MATETAQLLSTLNHLSQHKKIQFTLYSVHTHTHKHTHKHTLKMAPIYYQTMHKPTQIEVLKLFNPKSTQIEALRHVPLFSKYTVRSD